MKTPQFLNEQFVDQNILNTAMSQLHDDVTETNKGGTFLIPGVINPASLLFSFSGTLVVSMDAQPNVAAPFKCLFTNGAIAAGHGIVDGVDSGGYSVDFTSLVPIAGSITAFIVASYTTVQEISDTIIGPPPGHPDYTPNFIPYIGYSLTQDTLSISATATVPDNQNFIELARVTLTAGQTSIVGVDTSFEVPARVNVSSVPMAGDITGTSDASRISNLQANPVSAASPSVNQVLTWNGSAWVPQTLAGNFPPSGPAGGDLTGTYPNPHVAQSSASVFAMLHAATVAASLTSQTLVASSTITAGGKISGANATAVNNALMLGQFSGSLTTSQGGRPAGYISIPIFDITGVKITFIMQWGFINLFGQDPSAIRNAYWPIVLITSFTTKCAKIVPWFEHNSPDGTEGPFQNGMVNMEVLSPCVPTNSATNPLGGAGNQVFTDWDSSARINVAGSANQFPGGTGLLGISWLAWGY